MYSFRETSEKRPRRTDPLEDFRRLTEEGADPLLNQILLKKIGTMIGKADGYSTINKKTSPEELIGKIGSCRTINRETLPSRPQRTDLLDDFRPPTEKGADSLS